MALVKESLAEGIKIGIKKLESDFIKELDGGPLSSQSNNAKDIFDAMGKIKSKCESLGKEGAYDENKIKEITSNEWANAIAKQVISLLSDKISKIVADEIDKYIRLESVIIPPGQLVNTLGGPGVTVTPSPPGNIS